MTGFHIAADVKHPDSMTRSEKLKIIASYDLQDALKFWLLYCPRISKKAFNEARG
jgi:hypothetical protein